MSTQNRPPSFSSTTSPNAKRNASSSSANAGKVMPLPPHMAKKRAPLSNVTNQKNVSDNSSRNTVPSSNLVPCETKIAKTREDAPPPLNTGSTVISGDKLAAFSDSNSNAATFQQRGEAVPTVATVTVPVSSSMGISPCDLDGMSVSMDESTSTCDSSRSAEIEYMDNTDISAVDSVDRRTIGILDLLDNSGTSGNKCSGDILVELEKEDKIVNVDNNYMDPQLCATYACDIYKHLRASEEKKRPSPDFMERIQKDINPSMRAILIDWLVEVADEYRLAPETLYLTVNYLDRYLSGNVMNRQRFQLLGVACMMIACKYEEICAPQVEEFCYITDNAYFKEEVFQMESSILNYLKFEMTAPTIKCFLRRFVRVAQELNEVPSMQLECLAKYIAELSLLEYSMLSYAPSLIAASAIFLAKFILLPSNKPWNSTLHHYTYYQASDLCACVMDLHRLCCNSQNSNLLAIRKKYSQPKCKYMAQLHCPLSIRQEFFQN